MNKLQNVLASFMLVIMMLTAMPVYADDIVLPNPPVLTKNEPDVGEALSPMQRGQVAPFTGVLLSPKAIASILAQTRTFNDKLKLEVETARAEERAHCDFRIAEVKTVLEADKKILQAQIEEKTRRITILEEDLKKNETSSQEILGWSALSFGLGVGLTILTTFAIGQVYQQ